LSITGDNIKQPFISEDENIVIVFNGEIYNYASLFPESSELECIYKLYKSGLENLKQLDGEFAIVITNFELQKIFMIHDIFATKPLYIGIEEKSRQFCISSYPSVSTNLGITNVQKIPPNCCMEFDMITLLHKIHFIMFDWNLKQHKSDYNDFNDALENSVKKRVNTTKEILVNMSSGYDTGTICCVLNKLDRKYNTMTILGCENQQIIKERLVVNKPNISEFDTILTFNRSENEYYKKILITRCENIEFYVWNKIVKKNSLKLDIFNDPASLGLCKIYDIIKSGKKEIKIILSGTGVDEIISDYSINSKGLSLATCFNGIFPVDLKTIFPQNIYDKDCIWKNFYSGTQELYLFKEESLTGGFGLEGRYPFLDKYLVQEFLSLTSELKNSFYKSPLRNYMLLHNYPFCEEKKGFNPFS
jgi:asparagine synthase (glutamine-hydrolysing)